MLASWMACSSLPFTYTNELCQEILPNPKLDLDCTEESFQTTSTPSLTMSDTQPDDSQSNHVSASSEDGSVRIKTRKHRNSWYPNNQAREEAKQLQKAKRREQNRNAQRRLRDRKEEHIFKLEGEVNRLQKLQEQRQANQQCLEEVLCRLVTERNELRQRLGELSPSGSPEVADTASTTFSAYLGRNRSASVNDASSNLMNWNVPSHSLQRQSLLSVETPDLLFPDEVAKSHDDGGQGSARMTGRADQQDKAHRIPDTSFLPFEALPLSQQPSLSSPTTSSTSESIPAAQVGNKSFTMPCHSFQGRPLFTGIQMGPRQVSAPTPVPQPAWPSLEPVVPHNRSCLESSEPLGTVHCYPSSPCSSEPLWKFQPPSCLGYVASPSEPCPSSPASVPSSEPLSATSSSCGFSFGNKHITTNNQNDSPWSCTTNSSCGGGTDSNRANQVKPEEMGNIVFVHPFASYLAPVPTSAVTDILQSPAPTLVASPTPTLPCTGNGNIRDSVLSGW